MTDSDADLPERLLSGCPPGWHGILRDLSRQLAQQDPCCEIRYAREKFGMLDVMLNSDRRESWSLVRETSELSGVTCERCGGVGTRHARPSGWLKTLCPSCAASIGGYEILGETVRELTPDRFGVWRVTSTADGVEHYVDLISGRYSHSGGDSGTREVVAVEVYPSLAGGSMRLRLDGGETVTVEGIERIERIR